MSFKPATEADEDIIASRLPAPEADGSIDPAKLPKTLPGYLISLTAELTINGETIKAGAAGKMGGELYEEMGLWSPKDGWETSINHPTAGSYRAIGLNLQGINAAQAARLKQQLDQTKAKLESADEMQLAAITRHHIVGDLLYGTVFNYFALNDLQDQIAAEGANTLNYRLPSYGTFSTNLQTQYWFGLPRNVSFDGLTMDIDHMKQHRVSKNNNNQESIAFSQLIGARMSAMEHLIPEQMFSTEESQAQGISAVKALAIASQQGQKIWTIDKNNLAFALNRINLSTDAEADIRNAVNAGKIATAHESRINFNGWIGEGYVLKDVNTGAGAYMISGGGNGSSTVVSDALDALLNILSLGAGALELLFDGGPFQVMGRVLTWLSGALTVFGAFANCSGMDIFIVLVPLFLSIVWMFILGPFGFALAPVIVYLLGALIGLIAAHGTSELTAARCDS